MRYLSAAGLCLLIASASGCAAEGGTGNVRPGGGVVGGGTPGNPGGGGGPNPIPNTISGTICPTADLRFPLTCGNDGLLGVDIAERGSLNTATSDVDGNFDILTDGGAQTALLIGNMVAALRPSVVPVILFDNSAIDIIANTVLQSDWDDLTINLGVLETDDTGTVVVYVTNNLVPVANVEVIPPAQSLVPTPFYDGADAINWNQGGDTGTAGAAILFGVPVDTGFVNFTLIDSGNNAFDVQSVPVVAGAITFVSVDLAPLN